MVLIPGTPNAELVVVTQIELGRRLDLETWNDESGAYSIAHADGVVSGFWEKLISTGVIIKYAPVASLVDCKAAPSTYYYDTTTSVIYVNTSTGADPGGGLFIAASFFWESIGSDIIEISGIPCEPLLEKSSVPGVSQQISMQSQSGTVASFGTLKYNNGGGYFDSRLSAYIYQAKVIKCWIGNKGSEFTDFVPYFVGWTGDIELTDEWFSINVEDYRLYVP